MRGNQMPSKESCHFRRKIEVSSTRSQARRMIHFLGGRRLREFPSLWRETEALKGLRGSMKMQKEEIMCYKIISRKRRRVLHSRCAYLLFFFFFLIPAIKSDHNATSRTSSQKPVK